MSIIRTVEARCDAEGCSGRIDLSPQDAQPFQSLLRLGWGVEGAEGQTFCPDHKGDV